MRRLAQLLRDDGFVVYTAQDVRDARAVADEKPLDAALIDVRLPDGDGRVLADDWLARFPALHVIFVTIYPELIPLASAGARHTSMTKPVDYARLVSNLRSFAERRPR